MRAKKVDHFVYKRRGFNMNSSGFIRTQKIQQSSAKDFFKHLSVWSLKEKLFVKLAFSTFFYML